MKREIDAPEQEYLTDGEAATWLRIDAEDFREFVKLGIFPKGMPYGKTPAKRRWPWMDVVAIGYLIQRGHIQMPGDE